MLRANESFAAIIASLIVFVSTRRIHAKTLALSGITASCSNLKANGLADDFEQDICGVARSGSYGLPYQLQVLTRADPYPGPARHIMLLSNARGRTLVRRNDLPIW